MNCPVCNTTELSDDTTNCPHCHSDLELLQLVVRANNQRQTHKKLISALGIFAAVTAIGWASVGIFSGKTSESTPAELSPEVGLKGEIRTPADSELIAMLTTENASLKSENSALTTKLNTPVAKPAEKTEKVVKAEKKVKAEKTEKVSVVSTPAETEGGTIIHTVREGDTFWIIARKYFHDGRKYKQIAKDNDMTVKTKLHKGMKLKIQK